MPIEREYQDQRRKTILQILASSPMRRQIEIGRALRKLGYKVTQSTISGLRGRGESAQPVSRSGAVPAAV